MRSNDAEACPRDVGSAPLALELTYPSRNVVVLIVPIVRNARGVLRCAPWRRVVDLPNALPSPL